MIENPDVPPAVHAQAETSQEIGLGEPGMIGALTFTYHRGLDGFTEGREPLRRWSRDNDESPDRSADGKRELLERFEDQ